MPELIVNESTLREIQRAREALVGGGSLDAKRPRAWEQYGYPETITFDRLLQAYERGGPGHGAVHRLLDKCWQERPRVKLPTKDKESPWETKVAELLTSINAWQKLRDWDRRNMVGTYAALIYRVADGKMLDQPLTTAQRLVDIIPLYENQIEVESWHTDQTDADNFGKPKMWRYRTRRPGQPNQQAAPEEFVRVHPSRVQILAEGSVGDFLDGVPLLKAGFNSLVDLEKIAGGSAESFLKNSARTLVLKFDAMGSPQALAASPREAMPGPSEVKDAIQAKTDALNRNQDSSLVLQGGDASTLQTTVADPEPSFLVAANLFAASVQIPFTVLFGQQTGRMASDEDKADMIARCKSRQQSELTPAFTEFIRRMQACGVIESGVFEVEWPPLDAPGDTEKLENASKMAAINKTNFDAGQTAAFDGNEIRKVAGFEERDELADIPLEGDPMDDPTADPAADPTNAPPPAPDPAPRRQVAANDDDAGIVRRFFAWLRQAA